MRSWLTPLPVQPRYAWNRGVLYNNKPPFIRKAVSLPPSVLLVTGNGDAPNCRAVTAAVSLWLLGRGALGISHSRDLLTSKN
ncbi:hypothetical protein EMCRGX_G034500 [Ephydatia muelleri]